MDDRKDVREKHDLEWQPRLLRPGEEEALLRLLLDAYGTWPKAEISVEPLEHLRWKLEAGIEGYRAAVVEHDGAIVGAVLLSFRPLWIDGRTILGTSGGDVAVAPAYQDRGMFTAMTPFLMGVNMATADVSYGYRSSNVAVQKALPPSRRIVFGNYVNVLVASAPSGPIDGAPDDPWDLRIAGEFDERTDGFWKESAAQFDFIAARTRDCLNWRYCDRRAGDYTVVVAEQNGRLLGYVVGRRSHGLGYIADLLALPRRLDVVSALARRALADLRRAGVAEVHCWLASRHAYFGPLSALGFSAIKTTQDLTYRPLRAAEDELSFLRDPGTTVHFMAGDTDLV